MSIPTDRVWPWCVTTSWRHPRQIGSPSQMPLWAVLALSNNQNCLYKYYHCLWLFWVKAQTNLTEMLSNDYGRTNVIQYVPIHIHVFLYHQPYNLPNQWRCKFNCKHIYQLYLPVPFEAYLVSAMQHWNQRNDKITFSTLCELLC